MNKYLVSVLVGVAVCSSVYSQELTSKDYISRYIEGKLGLQVIVMDFVSKSRYEELYLLLDEISKRTNSYEVLVEKVKVGFPLRRDVMNELYEVLDSIIFERYIYNSVFSERRLLDSFSRNLLERKTNISETVVRNFSRLCFDNNYLSPLITLIKEGIVTNRTIISELLSKLEIFEMFPEIVEVYRSIRNYYDFGTTDLVTIARGLGEVGDEECLRILSQNLPQYIPLRIEFLIRFGYIQEGVEEARVYGVSSRNAKYVLIAFLNLKKFDEARSLLPFINQQSLLNYFSVVINILKGQDLLNNERKLRNMLQTKGLEPNIKNQVSLILWSLNTARDRDDIFNEVVTILNHFNNIKNPNIVSKRVLDMIKNKVEGKAQ